MVVPDGEKRLRALSSLLTGLLTIKGGRGRVAYLSWCRVAINILPPHSPIRRVPSKIQVAFSRLVGPLLTLTEESIISIGLVLFRSVQIVVVNPGPWKSLSILRQ